MQSFFKYFFIVLANIITGLFSTAVEYLAVSSFTVLHTALFYYLTFFFFFLCDSTTLL
jgi:hypothetical protein